MRFLFILMVMVSSTSAFGFEAASEDFRIDDQGRALRVSFPMHERVWCETGAESSTSAAGAGCGWDFRFALDFEDEAVYWRMRHRAARLRIAGDGGLRAILVEGNYHRHDESSFVLVPGPNWKIPAEFDLTFQYRLGDARFELEDEQPIPRELEVLDAAVLADFWRDPEFRGHLALGIAGRFSLAELRPVDAEAMPFTGLRFYSEWQSDDGLFTIGGRVTCGLTVRLRDSKWVRDCRGAASAEWVPLAINDMPVSLVLDAEAEESPRREWRVGASVRMSLPTE